MPVSSSRPRMLVLPLLLSIVLPIRPHHHHQQQQQQQQHPKAKRGAGQEQGGEQRDGERENGGAGDECVTYAALCGR